MKDRRLVIFYDSFYPAYKAGGPVQSLTNICLALAAEIDIYVVCSAYEADGTLLQGVVHNKWNEVIGVKAFYLTKQQNGPGFLRELLLSIRPDVFFINGMFSIRSSVMPLMLWHWSFRRKAEMIISPRGMLQSGALKIRALKKTIFLSLFKTLKLQKGVSWHATDEQEKQDIQIVFGDTAVVQVIPNIPKKPVAEIPHIEKREGDLKLVYLSLIAEKKNLMFALQCLRHADVPVTFDIYGPVKESGYWDTCSKELAMLPKHIVVKYRGDVIPAKVQETLASYHAFFLPTKGENFGHAIYECFSVGRPVIISDKTPWQDLEAKKAGWDIALDNEAGFTTAIHYLYQMDQAIYNEWCVGAMRIAVDFYWGHDLINEYKLLFK